MYGWRRTAVSALLVSLIPKIVAHDFRADNNSASSDLLLSFHPAAIRLEHFFERAAAGKRDYARPPMR